MLFIPAVVSKEEMKGARPGTPEHVGQVIELTQCVLMMSPKEKGDCFLILCCSHE